MILPLVPMSGRRWSVWCEILARNVSIGNVMTWKQFMHCWPFVRGIHSCLVAVPYKRASDAERWFLLISLFNSLSPSDAYMRQQINHHWLRHRLGACFRYCSKQLDINAGMLLIGSLVTNFSQTSIRIQTFSFKKMHLNMSSGKWRSFCLGLNELMHFAHV